MCEYTPSEKEIANARKVLDILSHMEGISYEVKREDLVEVMEQDSGISVTIDAEETIICLIMEVMDIPGGNREAFYRKLLELNDASLHGAFSVNNGKVYLKDNLESENLDPNELENSLAAMFLFVIRHLDLLEK
ncbi:MAG: CesT family type III secretion system chaperone [bacterium]